MARSSGNLSHSQQQPASPKQAATAVPQPKLIAGPEAIGREISVFQSDAQHVEWWDGKVTEFNSDSGQHLVRYHGREHRTQQWLQLNAQPFQWKSMPPATAASNPTVKGVHLNDSIIGRKVKIFWPAMSKWYLGHVKEYDAKSGRHTIKYKDGEVKDYALRHEAIWWLDIAPDAKFTASLHRSKGLSSGSHSGNQEARKQPAYSTGRTAAADTDSPRHRQKDSSAAEATQSTIPMKRSPAHAEAGTASGGVGSPKKRQHTAVLASSPETGTRSSLSSTGNREVKEQDDGSVSQSSCSRGPAETAYPDMHDEEEQTQGPSSRHAPNPAAKPSRLATLRQGRTQDWAQLAGEMTPGHIPARSVPAETPAGMSEAEAVRCAVGARVAIFWTKDNTFYKGILSGTCHRKSKVCYDDGEEDKAELKKEKFRWLTPRGQSSKHFNSRMRDAMLWLGAQDLASQPPQPTNPSAPTQVFVPDQRPGLSDSKAQSESTSSASANASAAAIPEKDAAVGWELSIFSYAEGKFVRGQVIAWGKRQRHHVLYEDAEDEWLTLAEERVQWHSRKSSIGQTAGLPKGMRTPKGPSVVGWRIGVYWTMDQKFYYGRVVQYNKDEATQHKYSITYDDGEEEDVDLTEQPMKWVLGPNVTGSSDAAEQAAPRRPKRVEARHQDSPEPRYQPVIRRSAGRETKRQKSRLGVTRISSEIDKDPSYTPKLAATPALAPKVVPNTALRHPEPSRPVPTAASQPTAVTLSCPKAPTLLHTTSATDRPATVAQRVPATSVTGSKSAPRLERIIGSASRRAPHLAGTRVKIFCSQSGRGNKSSRSMVHAAGQDADARRVKRRLEAVNQMIWRCECADTAITKGAPVPPNAADAAMHLPQASTISGMTDSRGPSHLGMAPSAQLLQSRSSTPAFMPASQQLLAISGPVIPSALNQQLPLAAAVQSGEPAASQLEEAVLIHQLPGSAPMLLHDSATILMSVNPNADSTSGIRAQTDGQTPSGSGAWLQADPDQCTVTHSRHPSPSPSLNPTLQLHSQMPQRPSPLRTLSPVPASRSPSGSLLGLGSSRQASPSSASLAELVPSTTAVTVPPYSVISAAKACAAQSHPAPVVMADSGFIPSSDAQGSWLAQDMNLAVRVGLRGEASFGRPHTPDQESLLLNRERSSLSKDQADAGSEYVHSDLSLDRKSHLSQSGPIDAILPEADQIDPAMIESYFNNAALETDKPDVLHS